MKNLFLFLLLMVCACTSADISLDKDEEVSPSFANLDYSSYLASEYAGLDNNPNLAISYLREVLKKDPDNETLIIDAYSLFALSGDIKSSALYADKLLKTNPKLFLPSYISITESLKVKDFDKAYNTIMNMTDDSYNLYIKPFILAWILAERGNFEEAYKTLEPLKQEQVFLAIYNFNMAMLKEKQGNLEEAKQYYIYSLANTSGLSLVAVKVLGKAVHRLGDEKLSNDILEKYREINFLVNDVVPLSYDGIPDVGYKFAVAEIYMGLASIVPTTDKYNRDFATIFYNLALYLYPDFSLAKVFLADNLSGLKNYEDANRLYISIPEDDEFYLASQLKLAHNYAKQNNEKEAHKIFYAIADKYPTIVEPYLEMGDIYRIASDFKNAEKSYTLALERADKKSNIYWALLYSRGIARERLKKWKEAETDLKEALLLNPDSPMVLNYLGYCWLDRGVNLNEAFKMIKKAFMMSEKDGHITDSLAWAYYLGGDYEKALKYMETALTLEPSNSIINDHLGDIYWELKRKSEARFQWKKALELDIDLEEKDRENIRKKLKYGKAKNVPKFKIEEEDTLKKNDAVPDKKNNDKNKKNKKKSGKK